MARGRGYLNRANRLRAACLGANDGILSTAALLVGVGATSMSKDQILISGLAGAAAGALSMAAGEFISVSAQHDIEKSETKRALDDVIAHPDEVERDLAERLEARGASRASAQQTAKEITEHDAENLRNRKPMTSAWPMQAASSSALSFGVGAAAPLLAAYFASHSALWLWVTVSALVALALLGAAEALLARAPVAPSVFRVVILGIAAMAATWSLGRFVDTALL